MDGPGLSIPFDPNGLQQIDQFQAGIRAATRELNALDGQMKKLAKDGKNLDEAQVARYVKLEAQKARLQESLNQQRELQKQHHENLHDAHKLHRSISGVRHIMQSPMVQKLMAGEVPGAVDIARSILQSERAVTSIAKGLGASMKSAGMAHPIAAVALEAWEFGTRIREKSMHRDEFEEDLSREIRQGKASRALRGIMEDEAEKSPVLAYLGLDRGEGKVKDVAAFAKKLKGLNQEDVIASLNAYERGGNMKTEDEIAHGDRWDKMTPRQKQSFQELHGKIAKFMFQQIETKEEERQKRDGVLSEEERDNIREEVIADFQKKGLITGQEQNDLQKNEVKEYQEKHKSPEQRRMEHERDRMLTLAYDIHRRRVSVSPED